MTTTEIDGLTDSYEIDDNITFPEHTTHRSDQVDIKDKVRTEIISMKNPDNGNIYSSTIYARCLPDNFESCNIYKPSFPCIGSVNKPFNPNYEIKVKFQGEVQALFLNKQIYLLLSPTIKKFVEELPNTTDESGVIESKLIQLDTFQVINDLMIIPMNDELETKIGMYILIEQNLFKILEAIDFLEIVHLKKIISKVMMNGLFKYIATLSDYYFKIKEESWGGYMMNIPGGFNIPNNDNNINNINNNNGNNNTPIDPEILKSYQDIKFESIEGLMGCCARYKLYDPLDSILIEMLESDKDKSDLDSICGTMAIPHLRATSQNNNIVSKLSMEHFWKFVDNLGFGENHIETLRHIVKVLHNKYQTEAESNTRTGKILGKFNKMFGL